MAFLICLCGVPTAQAQQENGAGQLDRSGVQSPVLTVDSDRLFSESAFGKSVAVELEAAGREIQAENNRIARELEAEEKDLTERRPDMVPEEFRKLANAFDQKAERIRAERAEASRALNRRLDVARREFLSAAVPILQSIMIEAGAAVVLEQRSVFISALAIDITELAIDRLDAAFENETQTEP